MISCSCCNRAQTSEKVKAVCVLCFPCPSPPHTLHPHLYMHLSISSSRQILPREQIILHAHKREREKERGGGRGRERWWARGWWCDYVSANPLWRWGSVRLNEWEKCFQGGVVTCHLGINFGPSFSRYYLGHRSKHPPSISFLSTPWHLLTCRFSPAYYISDMTYLFYMNLRSSRSMVSIVTQSHQHPTRQGQAPCSLAHKETTH